MKYIIALFQLLMGMMFLYSMASGYIAAGVESAISTMFIVGIVLTVAHVVTTPRAKA